MSPLESEKQFEVVTSGSFELNVSKFILSNDARKALLNMRAGAILDKVNINSMSYVGRPEELLQAIARSDIQLVEYDYLLELDTTNRDNLENDNEPTT